MATFAERLAPELPPQRQPSPKKWVVNWLYGGPCHIWNGERFTKTLTDELLLNVSEATRIKTTMKALGFTCVFLSER
jgi:hypothetical protein